MVSIFDLVESENSDDLVVSDYFWVQLHQSQILTGIVNNSGRSTTRK